MTIALWIINVLLACVFLAAGALKVARPKAKLAESGMGWAADLSAGRVKAIGAIEIIGSLGLILPTATGIAKILTPLAAVGLAIVMIGAVIVHVRRKEQFVTALVLLLLAIGSAVIGFSVV